MEITVTIKGLDELTKAITLVGRSIINNNVSDDRTSNTNETMPSIKNDLNIEEPKDLNIPVETPAYTFEQIQLACAELAKAGKRQDLANLIHEFGYKSLVELKEDKYNTFALKLREIGGII